MSELQKPEGVTPQYVLDRVTLSIKPMLDELKKDTTEIRMSFARKCERDDVLHEEMMKKLENIGAQNTNTTGRVGELEKVEILNKIVRYVLGLASLAILAMIGSKVLSGL